MLKHLQWPDDWEAWELDGKLLLEGHSVPATHLLQYLKVMYVTEDIEVDSSNFPSRYCEIEGKELGS